MGSSAFPLSGPPPPVTTRSSPPPTILSRRLPRKQLADTFLRRSDRRAFVVCANANTSRRKRSSNDIIMVDPLEAKRLAAKQMQEIRAKEKFKRRSRVEAINGAWAMVGLTAGLVVEGQTGKGILGQLAGYWASITSFFAG